MATQKTAIQPTRSENYPEWYQQVIKAADLAEQSPVRGCMVIKPWGYGIWENIQKTLDARFKETGHKNAYFPLFIPLSYIEKEAAHIEGFAKECAVVTHHRLEAKEGGGLKPAGELSEPYIVRPTSETIIGEMFSKWIKSYRDLPLLINQWANVVRWEMRPRIFLRTTEFLWQEGHTAHATQEDARAEVLKMLNIYSDFCRNTLAIPVIEGEKSESERFPGADNTYCIEAMMQDRKALQAGTSHDLGQNFAKSAQIKFLDSTGKESFAWTTSWGVSTRLIGGLIMTHADDNGMVIPPKIAPSHVVIIPVIPDETKKEMVMQYCHALSNDLKKVTYNGSPLRVELDERDMRGGEKGWDWIKKGIPIRVEVGPRDIESDSVFVGLRTKVDEKKQSFKRTAFIKEVPTLLDQIQDDLYKKALEYQKEHSKKIDNKKEFYDFFKGSDANEKEIFGGFAYAHWAGDAALEAQIKKDLNVTIRCIPLEGESEKGTCPFTGKPSNKRVIFARAY